MTLRNIMGTVEWFKWRTTCSSPDRQERQHNQRVVPICSWSNPEWAARNSVSTECYRTGSSHQQPQRRARSMGQGSRVLVSRPTAPYSGQQDGHEKSIWRRPAESSQNRTPDTSHRLDIDLSIEIVLLLNKERWNCDHSAHSSCGTITTWDLWVLAGSNQPRGWDVHHHRR